MSMNPFDNASPYGVMYTPAGDTFLSVNPENQNHDLNDALSRFMKPASIDFGIIITGKKYSGKTTLAQRILENTYAFGFRKASLADPIKTLACNYMGITREELDANKEALRPVLIAIGNAFRKALPDPLVVLASRSQKRLIFDDVRFPSEIESIRKICKHVLIIRVVASDATRTKRFMELNPQGAMTSELDPTETALDSAPVETWTHVFYNNGSLEELEDFAVSLQKQCLRMMK